MLLGLPAGHRRWRWHVTPTATPARNPWARLQSPVGYELGGEVVDGCERGGGRKGARLYTLETESEQEGGRLRSRPSGDDGIAFC
jgi:hypothetical protein